MDLHVDDVIELCQAFKENRTHHRDYMRDWLNRLFKKDVLLGKWKDEVEYHQRRLVKLMKEMDDLEWYDQDVWQKCFDTLGHKKRINNIHFLAYFNEIMQKFNTDPKSPFF